MFERATRLRPPLRFETPVGRLAVEDLWDLSLPKLNAIAVDLHHTLKDNTISFIDDAKAPEPRLQLSFDLVTHVITVKRTEAAAIRQASAKAEEKQKILAILARKQDEKLEQATEDELRAMIAAL